MPNDLVHAKVFANDDTVRYLPDPFRDFHYPYNIRSLLRLACFLPHDCRSPDPLAPSNLVHTSL